MADISYSLETLTGKHGGLLEVIEAIVSDGRLILILTDEDVLQRRDAPLKGIFYRVVLPLAPGQYQRQRGGLRTGPAESEIYRGRQRFGKTSAGVGEVTHVIAKWLSG